MNIGYDFYKHYNLLVKKDVYTGNGLSALINIGNSCFVNSILQCLSNTLKLTDYFLSTQYKEDIDTKKNYYFLVHSYLVLLNNIWDNNQLIKPKSFLENLSKFHKKYFSLEQQDSYECLLYILDIFHKGLKYEIEIDITGESKNEYDILMIKSFQWWQNLYQNDYSIIINLFYGSIIKGITCDKNCGYNETIFEQYNSFTLSINQNSLNENLYECLDNHFNVLEQVNDWKCEKCLEIGCVKQYKLWSLPNYIIINFKRFTSDSKKLTNHISFPLQNLDLTKYISKNKNDTNNYIYDLYAINYHHGDGLNTGHYTSSCKNLDNNWYNYNDGNITKYENTTNLQTQLVTNDAYILFYNRKFITGPRLM